MALQVIKSIDGTNVEILKNSMMLFNLATNLEIKKMCIEMGLIPKLFDLIKNHASNPDVATYCSKPLVQILSEATDTTNPKKSELINCVVEGGGLPVAMSICGTFLNNEEVLEQWFPLIDSCLDTATKVDSVGVDGISKIIAVTQKHRFVIQVTGASILSKLCENDDMAKALVKSGGVPLIVKILGTESNLQRYEQKSREVCIKCLNKIASFPEGIEAIRPCGLPKILDAGMRGYGTAFIIQVQGLLLIKALIKDDGMKQQLKDMGVGSLIAFSASKHTVTRLQNLVKELKETLGLF